MATVAGAAAGAVPPSRPRVVLDTNVCLDLFVFGDVRCAHLHAALRAGAIEAVTCMECEAEWQAVLAYPQLALAPAARERANESFKVHVKPLPCGTPATAIRLPRCADPDDQKFLDLAARAGARWLFSRDRALLALHRRCLRVAGFSVITPEAWAGLDIEVAADAPQGLSAKPV